MTSNQRLQQAVSQGEVDDTIRYLNRNQVLAVFIFVTAVVVGQLWAQTLMQFLTDHVFMHRAPFALQWFIVSLAVTVLFLLAIRFIFKVPVTAAFSL